MTEKFQVSYKPNCPDLSSNLSPPQYAQQQQQQQYAPAQTFTAIAPVNFGPDPMRTSCPSCHQQVITRINHEANWKTHLFALMLVPCCCIPYNCDSCQNANHYCSSCNAFLGTYK